jgi:phosphopantetheinyl transferase (holo-ACP synthase)
MVGNDIVDLRDPDADSTRYSARFDDRVFGEAERRAIANSASHERERWRFWAAKEASYKLARKRDCKTVFSPRAFVVTPAFGDRTDHVRVDHGAATYHVEIDETPERIHAVAMSSREDFSSLLSGVEIYDSAAVPKADPQATRPEASESEAVRRFACDAICERFELPRDQLAIRKLNGRIPGLYLQDAPRTKIAETAKIDEPLGLSLSLSHHGRWIAFACCWREGRGEDRGA